MFGDFDWSTDVLPFIQSFMNNGAIHAGIGAMVAIAIAALAGRGIVSVFFKRE